MKKLRAVIIDDEQDARYLLRRTVENRLEGIEIVGEADDVEPGIALIVKERPDVVLLDIQLGSGTGFDILEQVRDLQFETIFLTAYDQYAVKAFQFAAFSYLLKPIKAKELRETMDRLRDRIKTDQEGQQSRIKVLVEQYHDADKVRKLVVPHIDGFTILELKDILYLQADGNYTHFVVKGRPNLTASKTLKTFDELLHEEGFFRVHQSFLVNLSQVEGFQKSDGGGVQMSNGDLLQISRSRKALFLEKFI